VLVPLKMSVVSFVIWSFDDAPVSLTIAVKTGAAMPVLMT